MADEIEIIPHPPGKFQPTIFDNIKYHVTSKDTPVLLWSASNSEINTKKAAFTESTIDNYDRDTLSVTECNVCFEPFLPEESAFKVCVSGNADIIRAHDCQYFLCRGCIERARMMERPMTICPNCRIPLVSHGTRFMPCKTKMEMIQTLNKLVSYVYLCQSLN